MAGQNEEYVRFLVKTMRLSQSEADELKQAIEEVKRKSGRSGSDNLSPDEIREIATDLFPRRG